MRLLASRLHLGVALLILMTVMTVMTNCQSRKPQPLALEEVASCSKGFSLNKHKRRAPPEDFLQSLFEFVRNTCDENELYSFNEEERDIFKHLEKELALSDESSLLYRCSVAFELLRVSAAMESSYNWQQGRDLSANNTSVDTQEAGIFQTSQNSHIYAHKGYWGRWKYLDDLVASRGVDPKNGLAWIQLQKNEAEKNFVFEHHLFMIRHDFRHYGPMIDKQRVGANVSLSCVTEIQKQFSKVL